MFYCKLFIRDTGEEARRRGEEFDGEGGDREAVVGGEPAEEAEQLGGADGAGDPREAEAGAGPGDRVADRQVGGGGDCESGGV